MRTCLVALAVLLLRPSLAWAQAAMAVEFYHLDAQGNVLALTDWNGAVVESHDYDVFGQECMTGACLSNPGVGAGQPRKFTGKERDTETGWDYFGARYYGSKIGRFTTVDPALNIPAALVDPQRWNRYTYGRNNPLRYVDPDGKDIFTYFGGFVTAFGSNLTGGLVPRPAGGDSDFQFGQVVGDTFSLGAAGYEASVGGGLIVGGSGATLTVAGGTVGVPAAVGGGLLVGHAAAVGASAVLSLSKNIGEPGGPKVGSATGPGAGKRATPGQRQEALGENQGRCVFCDNPANEADHSVPKSRGGDTTTGPNGNLQPTCQHCNRQKGAKTSQEYVEWKKTQE